MSEQIEWISAAELARRLGVSRPAVTQATRNGRIAPNRSGKYNAVESVARFTGQDKQEDGKLPTLLQSRAAKEAYTARLKRLEFERESGDVVPIAKMERELSDRIAVARTRLLAIPAAVAPALAGEVSPAEIEKILNGVVREALTELAESRQITRSD